MTVLCLGGTSSPKPGLQDTVVHAGGAAALLGLIPELAWLEPFGILLGILAYDLTQLCLTDPPASPVFTLAEYTAVALSDVGSADYISAISKLTDLVRRIAWIQYCQCDSAPPPSFGSAPTQPGGLSYITGNGASSQCYTITAPTALATGTRTPIVGPFQLPTGSLYQLTTIPHDAVGSGTINRWEVWKNTIPNFSSASTAFPILTCDNGVGTQSSTFTSTAQNWYWLVLWDAGSGSGGHSQARLDAFCTNSVPSGCCPPDPSLAAAVTALQHAVSQLQRYEIPFAYVRGPAHAGLTGSGTITVPTGLVGLELALTTVPGIVGQLVANPDIYYHAGWWSVETVDSVIDERQVRHQTQLWFPRFMPTVSRVGYSLAPGVTATITEIEPEAAP